MSNLSLKAALGEGKFSVRTVIYIVLMMDFSTFPFLIEAGLWMPVILMFASQISLVLGLLVGLRGQGRYREMMIQLQSIARNRDLSLEEREARLVANIHHACLELGYIYQERNEEYGLNFNSKKKNNPNRQISKIKTEVNTKLNEIAIRQIFLWVAAIWAGFGLGLADMLVLFELRPAWIAAIMVAWYAADGLFFWYLKEWWGIKKEDIIPLPINLPEPEPENPRPEGS